MEVYIHKNILFNKKVIGLGLKSLFKVNKKMLYIYLNLIFEVQMKSKYIIFINFISKYYLY